MRFDFFFFLYQHPNFHPRVTGHSWIDIPIAVFPIALGTAGTAAMWFSIASLKPNSGIQYVGYSFLLLASLLWAIFFVLYALKIVFRWNDFRKESSI